MTSYPKPIEDLAIFDSAVFLNGDEFLTYNQAVKKFLKYPNAQGTENLLDTNVNGLLSANDDVIFSPSTQIQWNPTGRNYIINEDLPKSITTGTDNVVMGRNCFHQLTTGGNNVGFGHQAGRHITTGGDNIALGELALSAVGATDVADNIAIGASSLLASTNVGPNFARGNIAVGTESGKANTTGLNNIFIGRESGATSTTVSRSTALGYQADCANFDDSCAVGAQTVCTASNQIRLGKSNQTVSCPGTLTFTMASDNTSGTYYIPFSKVTGGNEGALFVDSTTGPLSYDPSTATLTCAYTNLSQGIVNPNTTLRNYFYTNRTTRPTTADNICIGHQAGNLISTGINNVCIGTEAGRSIATTGNNTCIGFNAGKTIANVFGNNTCIGSNAGASYGNEKSVFVGTESGFNSFNGGFNTCTGYQAGYTLTSGSGNTVYGALANQVAGNTNLTNSTSIGYQANNANFSTSVALGYQATNTAANQIRLGTATETVSCPNLVQVNSSYDAISVSANVSLYNTTTTGNVTIGNSMTTGGLTFGANLTSGNVVFGNASSGSPSSSFTVFPRGGWSGVFQVGDNSSSANFLCATNMEVNYPIKTSVTTAPTNVRHLGYSVVQSTSGWTTSLTAGTNTNITSQLFGVNDLGTWLFEAIIIYQLADNTSARQLQLDITTVSTTIAEYSSIEYSTANVGEPTMKTQRIINIYSPITVYLVGRTNGSNSTIVTTGSNGIFKWTRIG